jgi:hypothetical protein
MTRRERRASESVSDGHERDPPRDEMRAHASGRDVASEPGRVGKAAGRRGRGRDRDRRWRRLWTGRPGVPPAKPGLSLGRLGHPNGGAHQVALRTRRRRSAGQPVGDRMAGRRSAWPQVAVAMSTAGYRTVKTAMTVRPAGGRRTRRREPCGSAGACPDRPRPGSAASGRGHPPSASRPRSRIPTRARAADRG